MELRLIKIAFVAVIALFATIVVLNNVVDYGSNFQFVQHVLSMDTTFPGNRLLGRAVTNSAAHHAAYAVIIACEAGVATLCWLGAAMLWRNRAGAEPAFRAAKRFASLGLALGVLLWFGGFMTVGAEWFVMWQSETWNGQEPAFRFIMVLFATLIFLHLPGTDEL